MQSCGKPRSHRYFGITRSGYNLRNMSREEAMVIAVDPKVIPLGSKVLINFNNKNYKKYNGIYTARDTGGAIKGLKIDLFMGDSYSTVSHKSILNFGVTKAKIIILSKR